MQNATLSEITAALAAKRVSSAELTQVFLERIGQLNPSLNAYITVDPDRDDAARMRRFLGAFDPSFIGGTGTAPQLAAVRKDYGISVSAKIPVPGGGYALNHSSFIYLIDRSGKLRALMPYGHGPDDFVHDVRILLQQ
jgi:protein SCO1/2